MDTILTRQEFDEHTNKLNLNKNFPDENLWRNAQAFTIQFTKFCQTCGYTAPEVVRLFGSKLLLHLMQKLLLSAHKSLSMGVIMNDALMEVCYAPNIKIKGQTQCSAHCSQRHLPELQY